MRICPKCGRPNDAPSVVMADSFFNCRFCDYKGVISDTLVLPKHVEDRLQDMFSRMYVSYLKEEAHVISRLMVENGFMEPIPNKENAEKLARILKDVVPVSFRLVSHRIVEEFSDRNKPADDSQTGTVH